MKILDGKFVAKLIQERISQEILYLDRAPSLHTILVGENPASKIYVNIKKKTCDKLGIKSVIYRPQVNELESLIRKLNEDDEVDGILVQSPLPNQVNFNETVNLIDPKKDVDGLTNESLVKLYRCEDGLKPCTPKGILNLLKNYKIKLSGQNVVILGRSDIVGRSLSLMLNKYDSTVSLLHSKTRNLIDYTKIADVLIAAVGVPNFVSKEMVKKDAVVVDVGISRVKDLSTKRGYRLVGDVNFNEVKNKASYITPVPGGVGPMTIVSLMENIIKAYKKRN